MQSLGQLEEQAREKEQLYVSTPNNYVSWQHTLRELSLLRVDLTKKSMLACAQRVFEYGDKNDRLLAWLAKGQYATTHVGRLRNADGALLTTPGAISNRFLQFYQQLYSTRADYTATNLSEYLDLIPLPALNSDQSKALDEDITLEEFQTAMSCMQAGKAPGPDGIPIEFYSQQQELLAPRLTSLLSQFYTLGSLLDSV